MTTANINTVMLNWARERSGFTVSEFAKKLGISETRLLEWESGQHALTFNQAMQYSEKAHIPFGYLFLKTPPVDILPIPDLRTLGGESPDRLSIELLDLVKLMLERQEWYKEYLRQQLAEPNQVVGKFSVSDGIISVVRDMRLKLGVEAHPLRGNWEDYYRNLVTRIERLGILVMRQADLGHHSRPLKVDEFRGFAIIDEFAPIIFVNHADAPGARLFTLIHELCHIWIGQSGISDGNVHNQRQGEIFCNAVSAEFLVPADEFSHLWLRDLDDWRVNLPTLEHHFHVSTWVLARRALTLGFIHDNEYLSYVGLLKSSYFERDKSGSGPSYYKTKKAQISLQFSKAVVEQALSGQMMLREAGWLLGGMKPNNIAEFAKELGI